MAKVVDITEKLSFDGNPCLEIKGKKLEVNADAPTMLKVMGLMGGDEPSAKEIVEVYEMLFSSKAKKEIETLRIGFRDLIVIVQEAVGLIVGDDTTSRE